ncbi:hypothetical protein [Helicobacter canis]|uniref:D-lactate dehydrogenase n=1 Tax=Helicobacter canis TaxID=29419 RepID=A0A377J319_9HELI|nr:hypothetical protein [Helicobacter canis]STO96216.1 D-lactate dehydrogenase [Helicobacter canis]STO96281.1 D-lactate dehydrogenase [Helicobacter canis]
MIKVDSSVFMDRHADKSARDDRASNNSKPTTQAAGFSSDFWGFQAVGEGILLGVNEQAHRAESTKSAEKTTRERSVR